jgi:hypothetical protein
LETHPTYLRLTRRWFPLHFQREHSPAEQMITSALKSRRRFKTIHAGRRSYKTEIFGKRRAVLWLWKCKIRPRPWTNPRRFIAAPTRQQVKDIYWADVKALTPPAWIDKISETELSITTKWGAELRLVGLDQPARIEGTPWDEGSIDEYADTKPGIFDAHIRPAIADRGGCVDFLGVPDFAGSNQADYLRLCGLNGTNDEWADFYWGSGDILPASEVESMRQGMLPELFEQETTGLFIARTGRAFPRFNRADHVRALEYDPILPVCIAFDFNYAKDEANPSCMGIIQHAGGEIRVLAEVVRPRMTTDQLVDAAIDTMRAKGMKFDGPDRLYVYGDSSGNAGQGTSGVSNWFIIRNRLPNAQFRVPQSNPRITDTVNAVNSKVRNAAGLDTLFIDSSAMRLISDMETAELSSDLRDKHCLAWLRYFVHAEYPVMFRHEPQRYQ